MSPTLGQDLFWVFGCLEAPSPPPPLCDRGLLPRRWARVQEGLTHHLISHGPAPALTPSMPSVVLAGAVQTVGPPPPARFRHTAALYSNKMVVLGGQSDTHVFNDLHILTLKDFEPVWSGVYCCGTSFPPSVPPSLRPSVPPSLPPSLPPWLLHSKNFGKPTWWIPTRRPMPSMRGSGNPRSAPSCSHRVEWGQ